MPAQLICLRHVAGWCPVCGAAILDAGYTDDPDLWEHAWLPHQHGGS